MTLEDTQIKKHKQIKKNKNQISTFRESRAYCIYKTNKQTKRSSYEKNTTEAMKRFWKLKYTCQHQKTQWTG